MHDPPKVLCIANFLAASRDDENGDDDDDDDGAEYEQGLATFLLENWAFLYEDPETRDADKIYRSVFMLELIESAHINAIAGFLDVLALNTDALQVKGMQAVIAASAAALERAFNFAAKPKVLKQNNTSSKESTAISAFSEANCGSATSEYYESLKRRGVKYTADIIALVRKRQEAAKKLKSAPAEELKPKGERALLSNILSSYVTSLPRQTRRHTIKWDTWGPTGTRFLKSPPHSHDVWTVYVFGSKFVSLITPPKTNAGQPLQTVQVWDFNQLAIKRATALGVEKDNVHYVSDTTVVEDLEMFATTIRTSLPYSVATRTLPPRSPEDPTFTDAMCSEDTILLVDENRRRGRVLIF
ncbi:hypothetical protein P692DRAFT_20874862 [Suillus brevipes Sb2]|nr:hypothetical protein P692DRAFT_20874862 [Suillus brevipes Sb2]